jgi:hypothetical protein
MYRVHTFCFVLFFLLMQYSTAQLGEEIDYSYYSAKDVITPQGYTSEISLYGTVRTGDALLRIPYPEDQHVENPILYTYTNGQYIETEQAFTTTGIITEMFFTGLKCLQTKLKSGIQFRLDYRVKSASALLYQLPTYHEFFRYDSVNINIQTKGALSLLHREVLFDGALKEQQVQLKEFKQENGEQAYQFTYHKDNELWKRIPENLIFQEEGIRFCFSPIIEVTPLFDQYKNHPWLQLEAWIKPQLIKSGKMNADLKKYTDSLCGDEGQLESARKIFEFARDKINYIAIENGIWAFRPQPINQTFAYRLGDCKAKALLMTQMLSYRGVPSWFCLASTINSSSHLDFPAVFSANHAICMVEIGSKKYFLDPTMETQNFDQIPESVAGKNIFAISLGDRSAEVIQVPALSAENFQMKTNLQLRYINDTLKGSMEMIADKNLTSIFRGSMNQIPKEYGEEVWRRSFFEQTGRGCTFSDFSIDMMDTILITKALVEVQPGKVIHTVDRAFLMMDFLPFRLEYFNRIPEGFCYRFITPMQLEMELEIEFPNLLPPQKDISGKFDEGMFFMDYFSQIKGSRLKASLTIKLPAGEISGGTRETYNDFIETLNNTLHYGVQIY